MTRRCAEAHRSRNEHRTVFLKRRTGLPEIAVDVGFREVKRGSQKVLLEVGICLDTLLLQVGESASHLEHHQHHEAHDDGDDPNLGHRNGEPLGPAMSHQEVHKGH